MRLNGFTLSNARRFYLSKWGRSRVAPVDDNGLKLVENFFSIRLDPVTATGIILLILYIE